MHGWQQYNNGDGTHGLRHAGYRYNFLQGHAAHDRRLGKRLHKSGCLVATVVSVLVTPEHGAYFKVNENNEIEYTGSRSGFDSMTYIVTCGGVEESEDKVYITVNASASAFVDDVWY